MSIEDTYEIYMQARSDTSCEYRVTEVNEVTELTEMVLGTLMTEVTKLIMTGVTMTRKI